MVAEIKLRGVKVTLMAMMEVNHGSCVGKFSPIAGWLGRIHRSSKDAPGNNSQRRRLERLLRLTARLAEWRTVSIVTVVDGSNREWDAVEVARGYV